MFNQDASPTVTHCNFTNNWARDGGAIFNDRSSNPALTQCTFLDNRATRHGGGMYNENSMPILTDCIFGDNSLSNQANLGGGVYNRNASPIFTTCRFETNIANDGGGMYNESSSPTLTECTFDSNLVRFVGGRGGGMYCENASPTLTDCEFTGNRAVLLGAAMGGALFCDATSAPAIHGCRFENNQSHDRGGAIYCDSASPAITDTVFIENQAENDRGGGIYLSPGSSPVITDCTFQSNMAKQGGGICCDGASPSIVQSQILENEATLEGGGIFMFNYAAPTITGCTIDGNYTTAYATMAGGMYCSFSSPVVQDTVISNNTSKYGAGVVIREYSEAAFSNCTISNNEAGYDMGGVYCLEYSSARFSECAISGNTALAEHGDGYGGGVGISIESTATLKDCLLWQNHAAGPGGAVIVYGSGSSLNVINSIFWDNETNSFGGGIYNFFASAMVTNSTFWRNTAGSGGGGFYNLAADSFTLTNSILWANTADQVSGDPITAIYSDIEGGHPGAGNIDANPFFQDPANGDFHLSLHSPCIDTGSNLVLIMPEHDFEGDKRILDGDLVPGAIVDMGADEFVPTWGAGDIDEDGDVDGLDLAALAAGYGTLYDEDFLAGFAQNFGRLEPY
jgi:predicted outer membrane repeat protein